MIFKLAFRLAFGSTRFILWFSTALLMRWRMSGSDSMFLVFFVAHSHAIYQPPGDVKTMESCFRSFKFWKVTWITARELDLWVLRFRTCFSIQER